MHLRAYTCLNLSRYKVILLTSGEPKPFLANLVLTHLCVLFSVGPIKYVVKEIVDVLMNSSLGIFNISRCYTRTS